MLQEEKAFCEDYVYVHCVILVGTVGGACAIAVIFNAPFGGLLYMFEEWWAFCATEIKVGQKTKDTQAKIY